MAKQLSSRIVLIVNSFPKLSETFIVSKFTGLLSRGVDAHVVCGKSKKQDWSAFPELCENSDTRRRVHETWPITPKFLAALLLPFSLLRGLVRAPKTTLRYLSLGYKKFGIRVLKHYYLDQGIICLKPDIIHFEFGALAVGKTYLKSLLNLKIGVSFRGYDLNFSNTEKSNYYEDVWKNADCCHFLSYDLWNQAQKRGCPAELPHRFIPPAINLTNFPIDKVKQDLESNNYNRPLRILSIGRLDWKKGYEYALVAISQLVDRGIRCQYHIIGDGEHSNALRFTREDLGLSDSVDFLGPINPNQIANHLAWADIFLHPSLSEGFCNAVIEAQAMSLPVVCSDAGGLPENVVDGETGFVVPRRNAEAITEKLFVLSRDSVLQRRMGVAGRERVERLFQLENQIDSWISFYRELSI